MGLSYMPTLTPQTTPTDRHIWQSHGVSGKVAWMNNQNHLPSLKTSSEVRGPGYRRPASAHAMNLRADIQESAQLDNTVTKHFQNTSQTHGLFEANDLCYEDLLALQLLPDALRW